MGYYNYQRGLIYHHLEEAGSWNSHLKNCRNFILKSVDFYKPSKVTVLGSGWLLDLPLKELNDTVEEIYLVDIIHPPEVKEQTADLKKVVLTEEDITGGLIEEVWNKSHNKTFLNRLKSLEAIEVPEYHPATDPGMVISLNILTQLESMPLDFLKKKSGKNDKCFLQFRKEVQSKHLSFLKKYKSVLITDISEVVTEKSGNIREEPSVLTDLPDAKFKDEWTWNFDFNRSDYYNKSSVFKVAALVL